MPSMSEWRVPPDVEPVPEQYDYDLRRAVGAVLGLKSTVPEDAASAETLGTERAGHAVAIREDGLVLTIGYLVTEAEKIWLTTGEGRLIEGDAIGYDPETGFGVIQALGRLNVPALRLGSSANLAVGARVVAAGAGGLEHSVAAFVAAKQEFAGYWEYVLDEAIFTVPAHPFWGGSALIDPAGDLVGIGSLQLQQSREDGSNAPLNMFVPIDLLKPILDDILTTGRPKRPPRPWLGLYATDMGGRVVIAGLAARGPAAKSDLKRGDIVLSVGGRKVESLAGFYRSIWSLGPAGVDVPMALLRDGNTLHLRVTSADRTRQARSPRLH